MRGVKLQADLECGRSALTVLVYRGDIVQEWQVRLAFSSAENAVALPGKAYRHSCREAKKEQGDPRHLRELWQVLGCVLRHGRLHFGIFT